ncbi:hypothetical protein [Streptomyces sp. CCM_MD2014]|uniref:hypothetical protein n=1 Tax=Streptomyces sp. CCM_MD2014 TaxID=1561022 RepID=UPI001F2B1C16|nr:hypothetical protein [Streptomyces sp. CCM_MD2014]
MIAREAGGWASAATVEQVYGHVDVHDRSSPRRWSRCGGHGRDPLTLLPGRTDTTRIGRDRLELLTALIEAPAFDRSFATR